MNFGDQTLFYQDQPIINASAKSKKWMFGLIFLLLEVLIITWVCLITIFGIYNLQHIPFIVLAVVFLLFIIALIPFNSKASITFNPNNETVTMTKTRNFIKRIFCMKKDVSVTMDLSNITSSSLTVKEQLSIMRSVPESASIIIGLIRITKHESDICAAKHEFATYK
ncbi:MAG: hypothetical protein EZS28_042949 [Streblomastix strix]|uniref:Uncharacterized protein n=1 Tax=Streblomastix strix TaxID=222440 RepID=A0A5J4TT99_9EUKA|nr:MAG: hypothetical protein EZS28_042949 [Streblomastix strix]